ncbi:hypothetical protein [Thomasclavelia ramosa]|uniref:hypothetical protein n=1 Tax=Thomasclavelia ramosa TaxID=1547 RepID=UPI0022E02D62|nr:hypothetical protein [Thomasclavelia ramosa]
MKENEEKTDESTSDCRDTNDWRFGQDGGEEVEIHYSGKIIKDHINLIEIFDASPYPTKSIETDKLQVEKIFKEDILENSSIHKVTKKKRGFKMEEKTCNVVVKIKNLDEVTTKLEKYNSLLKEAKTLQEELASFEPEFIFDQD